MDQYNKPDTPTYNEDAMRYRLFLLTIALLALFPWDGAAQDPPPADDTALRIALPLPQSLDPARLSRFDSSGRDLVANLFVSLTRFNASTGQIEPMLAESWTVSPDGLLWTFTLRDDINWIQRNAVGEFEIVRPVVAGDVVAAVQRACDPQRPSPFTPNIFLVEGCRTARTNNSLQAPPLSEIGINAPDDTTLEIRLTFPAGYFLSMTTLPEFSPLPVELINDSLGNWPRPGAIISSGPWAVVAWEPGSNMQLVPNPHWPVTLAGNVSALDVRFDLVVDALPLELSAGGVDFARLDPSIVNAVRNGTPDLVRFSDGGTLRLLGFSFSLVDEEGALIPSPLDNPAVRRALALAIDRERIAETLFGPAGRAADHFTPRSVIAAPSAPGARFDPAAANRLLAEAGYTSCASLGVLPILVNNDGFSVPLAQQIVTEWGTHLGCPPETFPIAETDRLTVLNSAHPTVDDTEATPAPLRMISWTADYPDAHGWIADALHCEYGYFRVGRGCDSTDNALGQAGLGVDVNQRFSIYNQAETQFFGANGAFPVIPLIMEQDAWAQQAYLDGIARYGVLQFDRWMVTPATE